MDGWMSVCLEVVTLIEELKRGANREELRTKKVREEYKEVKWIDVKLLRRRHNQSKFVAVYWPLVAAVFKL